MIGGLIISIFGLVALLAHMAQNDPFLGAAGLLLIAIGGLV